MDRSQFISLILILVALTPIVIVDLKGTLNPYSISALKLSEKIIEEGYYATHPLNKNYALAREVNFRSEWRTSSLTLAILSLTTGISPFAIKKTPMGLLMILVVLFLAKCLGLSGYWSVAYAILVGFSSVMIPLVDYSQFLIGFLLFFTMLSLWVRAMFSLPNQRNINRLSSVILLVMFFIALESYYTSAFIFLCFELAAILTVHFKRLRGLSAVLIRPHNSLVIALGVVFLSKIWFHSSIFAHIYGGSWSSLVEQLNSTASRHIDFLIHLITREQVYVAQANPRATNYLIQLTYAFILFSIAISITIWLLWRKVRRFPWLHIGIGILFVNIAEYVIGLPAKPVSVYLPISRSFLLLGPLLSLHVARELFKGKRKLRVIAITILILLFVGHVAGWAVRVWDENVYHSSNFIPAYQFHSAVCQFSIYRSSSGQRILTSSDMAFLVLAYGDITRASDISSFGEFVGVLDDPNSVSLERGTIIVFSRLFGSVKSVIAGQGTFRLPSEKYVLNLQSSPYLNKVYDDGIGIIFVH